MKTKTILIVEDEPMLIKALADRFAKENINILTAHNGVEGLKLLESNKVDLILLDIVMPMLDGIGMLKEMKKKNLDIAPVIILSNLSQEDNKEEIKELNIREYLIKSNNDLKDIVRLAGEVLSE